MQYALTNSLIGSITHNVPVTASPGFVDNGYRSGDMPQLGDSSPPSSLEMAVNASALSAGSPCLGDVAISECSAPNSVNASPIEEEEVSLNQLSTLKESSPTPTEWKMKESKEESNHDNTNYCVECGQFLSAKINWPCIIGAVQPNPCPSCTTTLSSIRYHPEDNSWGSPI